MRADYTAGMGCSGGGVHVAIAVGVTYTVKSLCQRSAAS